MLEYKDPSVEGNIWFATIGILIGLLMTVLGMMDRSDQEEEEEENENDYLVHERDLASHRVRHMQGNKKNSVWLVVDEQYIMHRNDQSTDGSQHYWECSHRRKIADCRFVY